LKLPDDEEVDERDVPIVCLGGSGGGFRAVSWDFPQRSCPFDVVKGEKLIDSRRVSFDSDAGIFGDDGGCEGSWDVGFGEPVLSRVL